jgi:hypothetical protein
LQQVPFRELKQAKKASEEAGEIFNICTKLEQLSLRRKSKQKKLQKKQQNLWNNCTQLAASSLQRIEASKKEGFRRSKRNLQHLY